MSANTAVQQATATIYKFPAMTRRIPAAEPAEVLQNLYDMKITAIEDGLNFIVPVLIESLTVAGYSLGDDLLNSTLISTIRAIMCEHFCLEHPLTKFVHAHKDELQVVFGDQTDIADIASDLEIYVADDDDEEI